MHVTLAGLVRIFTMKYSTCTVKGSVPCWIRCSPAAFFVEEVLAWVYMNPLNIYETMKKLDLYVYRHEVDIKSNYNSRFFKMITNSSMYVLFSLVFLESLIAWLGDWTKSWRVVFTTVNIPLIKRGYLYYTLEIFLSLLRQKIELNIIDHSLGVDRSFFQP